MVFYMDNEGINSVGLEKPTEDEAILMVHELKYLRDFDIKNFNYYLFEDDIDNMTQGEFEWWYKAAFEPWLQNLDEYYIDIEYDDLVRYFANPDEKILFLKKFINFIMFFFPFQILKQFLKNKGYDDLNDYLLELKDDNINGLIQLRIDILDIIDDEINRVDNFVTTLAAFEKVAKKTLVESSVNLLDDHIKKRNYFLGIFKEIISNTDMEKFLALLEKYNEVDPENI